MHNGIKKEESVETEILTDQKPVVSRRSERERRFSPFRFGLSLLPTSLPSRDKQIVAEVQRTESEATQTTESHNGMKREPRNNEFVLCAPCSFAAKSSKYGIEGMEPDSD